MFRSIIDDSNFNITTGGPEIEIEDLANMIICETKSSSRIFRSKDFDNAKSDIYLSNDNSMDKLFNLYGTKISDLKIQISNTVEALLHQN